MKYYFYSLGFYSFVCFIYLYFNSVSCLLLCWFFFLFYLYFFSSLTFRITFSLNYLLFWRLLIVCTTFSFWKIIFTSIYRGRVRAFLSNKLLSFCSFFKIYFGIGNIPMVGKGKHPSYLSYLSYTSFYKCAQRIFIDSLECSMAQRKEII